MKHEGALYTIQDLIPSKDLQQYLIQIGWRFSDFDKAALIYNYPESWDIIWEKLKKLQADTEDKDLARQIEERLEYDKKTLQQIKTAPGNNLFLLEVYDDEADEDEEPYKVYFASFDAAKTYAETLGREYSITQISVYDKTDVSSLPTDPFDINSEMGYISYDRSGEILRFSCGKMDDLDPVVMSCNHRFEEAYVTIPHPFTKGDIVRNIQTDEMGVIPNLDGWESYDSIVKNSLGGGDFSDMQICVEYLYPNGEFGHKHTRTTFLEYADVQKMDINTISLDDFPRLVLKEASFLIRGHGSIQMLQMFLEDYIRMEREKSKKNI